MSIDLVIFMVSLGYLLFAYTCMENFYLFKKNTQTTPGFHPPVSILKPVCGLSSELEENLKSFCQQDYPVFQVIFGLQDENDPAIPVIKKIIESLPDIDITLVINKHLSGKNYKVSNLVNMFPFAKHDFLVITDDDMRVSKNYLQEIIAPFSDRKTGAVTCLYSGIPKGGIIASLHAMFINEWFLPSVLISRAVKKNDFCLGATMAIKRESLAEIGGFEALVNYLADDYMLGKLVTGLGKKIHLSNIIVKNVIPVSSLKSVLLNEIRWARTMRTMEPTGYFFTFVTDTLVISCITGMIAYYLTHQWLWPVAMIGSVLVTRMLLHLRINDMIESKPPGSVWLIPLRDFLTFFIRIFSFAGNSIEWRNRFFSVDKHGVLFSPANTPIIATLATDQTQPAETIKHPIQ